MALRGVRAAVRLTAACRTTINRPLSSCTGHQADQVIHTGQQWDEADPRSVRFAVSGLQKETNKKWAIDLIAEVPPQKVTKRIVSCDGGGGPLGHPKIYINLDPTLAAAAQSCNYCGLRFELEH